MGWPVTIADFGNGGKGKNDALSIDKEMFMASRKEQDKLDTLAGFFPNRRCQAA